MPGCSNRARGGRSESLSAASVGSSAVANRVLPQIKEMIIVRWICMHMISIFNKQIDTLLPSSKKNNKFLEPHYKNQGA